MYYCSGTIYQKDGGGYSRDTTAQVLYIRRAEEGIHVTLLLRYYISEGRRRVFTCTTAQVLYIRRTEEGIHVYYCSGTIYQKGGGGYSRDATAQVLYIRRTEEGIHVYYCSGTIYQKDGGGYSRDTTAQVLYIRRTEEGIHVTLLLRYYISEGRRRVFTCTTAQVLYIRRAEEGIHVYYCSGTIYQKGGGGYSRDATAQVLYIRRTEEGIHVYYCSGTIYQKDGGGYSRVLLLRYYISEGRRRVFTCTTAQVLYIRRAEEGIHVTLLLRYYISEGRRRVFTCTTAQVLYIRRAEEGIHVYYCSGTIYQKGGGGYSRVLLLRYYISEGRRRVFTCTTAQVLYIRRAEEGIHVYYCSGTIYQKDGGGYSRVLLLRYYISEGRRRVFTCTTAQVLYIRKAEEGIHVYYCSGTIYQKGGGGYSRVLLLRYYISEGRRRVFTCTTAQVLYIRRAEEGIHVYYCSGTIYQKDGGGYSRVLLLRYYISERRRRVFTCTTAQVLYIRKAEEGIHVYYCSGTIYQKGGGGYSRVLLLRYYISEGRRRVFTCTTAQVLYIRRAEEGIHVYYCSGTIYQKGGGGYSRVLLLRYYKSEGRRRVFTCTTAQVLYIRRAEEAIHVTLLLRYYISEGRRRVFT